MSREYFPDAKLQRFEALLQKHRGFSPGRAKLEAIAILDSMLSPRELLEFNDSSHEALAATLRALDRGRPILVVGLTGTGISTFLQSALNCWRGQRSAMVTSERESNSMRSLSPAVRTYSYQAYYMSPPRHSDLGTLALDAQQGSVNFSDELVAFALQKPVMLGFRYSASSPPPTAKQSGLSPAGQAALMATAYFDFPSILKPLVVSGEYNSSTREIDRNILSW